MHVVNLETAHSTPADPLMIYRRLPEHKLNTKGQSLDQKGTYHMVHSTRNVQRLSYSSRPSIDSRNLRTVSSGSFNCLQEFSGGTRKVVQDSEIKNYRPQNIAWVALAITYNQLKFLFQLNSFKNSNQTRKKYVAIKITYISLPNR